MNVKNLSYNQKWKNTGEDKNFSRKHLTQNI
jgi:hypothetical protein